MIQIERDVPLPQAKNRTALPYDQLEVGQSFFVPNGDQNSIASQAWRWGLKLKRTFVTRKLDDGVRVWRTA